MAVTDMEIEDQNISQSENQTHSQPQSNITTEHNPPATQTCTPEPQTSANHPATPESGPTQQETPQPSGLPPRPPTDCDKRQPKPKASGVWEFFTKTPDGKSCHCNFCNQPFKCDTRVNGTSALWSHINLRCEKNPNKQQDKRQKILSFDRKSDGTGVTLGATAFNQNTCALALVKMIIVDELPFSFVDYDGFHHFFSVACPKFVIPSRRTLVRDIGDLFVEEKTILKSYFEGTKQRVSLTSDCWTSIQNVSYLCLTAHYIDEHWCMHKKILNFCVVPNHSGDTMGRVIETCLHDWGIERLFTITLDNASANTTMVSYLQRKMKYWRHTILEGDYVHVRCAAHIVNLIVSDGLKEHIPSIEAIRNSIRYVRSSPSRTDRFKQCIQAENIESNKLLCLDVPTRWNSTYLMLETAIIFQKAFDRLYDEDANFKLYFAKDASGQGKVGPPSVVDWAKAKVFVVFLKCFYDVTLKFSSSLSVTSNIYFLQVSAIQKQLDSYCMKSDATLSSMARKMREKFEKYWGDNSNYNKVLVVGAVLDPRYKMDYVKLAYNMIRDTDSSFLVDEMIESVMFHLMRLYDWYYDHEGVSEHSGGYQASSTSSSNPKPSETAFEEPAGEDFFNEIMTQFQKQREEQRVINEVKNDVER